MIDLKTFETSLAKYLRPKYRPSQFEGFALIVDKFEKMGQTNLKWLAYILATALHETAHTMKPVTEYGGPKYLKSKPYWPFVGRGYVQLTWQKNYAKYGIEKTPEKALEPDFAAHVLIDGMIKGTFSGKSLGDYTKNDVFSPVYARYIVNGRDKAVLISSYYSQILAALNEAKILEVKLL